MVGVVVETDLSYARLVVYLSREGVGYRSWTRWPKLQDIRASRYLVVGGEREVAVLVWHGGVGLDGGGKERWLNSVGCVDHAAIWR